MSTVVYQGFESCLESQMMESRTLKLKLVSPKNTVLPQSLESALKSCIVKLDSPLSPPNVCITSDTKIENLKVPYVHPSANRASWWLSDKSLSLCTENLGSETGSEFVENSIFSSPAYTTSTDNKIRVAKEHRQPSNRRIPEAKKQLPPPLTTLSGKECLDIRTQREDGRLILKAIRTTQPARRSCFLVDRSNGRLRLSLPDSRTNMYSSKEEVTKVTVTNDQKVTTTNNKEDEYENQLQNNNPADENAACSGRSLIMEVVCVEMKNKYSLDQHITRETSHRCRCEEIHKNAKKKGLMKSMVKLEPRFLVASS